MNSNKHSLASKISELLTTTPAVDDDEDDTIAKLPENVLEGSDDEEILSQFRKQNVDLLEDLDNRYAGKKSSRKKLVEDEDSEDNDDEDSEDNDEGEEDSDEELNSEPKDGDTSVGNEDEEDSGEEEEELESADGEEDGDDGSAMDSEVDDTNFKHMNDSNLKSTIKKGSCVRNQLSLWENVLEMRIQMQKCLVASNKMPQMSVFQNLLETESDFANKVSETKRNISNVLNKFLELQTVLTKQFPETKTIFDDKKLLKKGKIDSNDGNGDSNDNEEVASDTEEELNDDSEEEEEEIINKKRKITDFPTELAKRHCKYSEYRNSVIQKWYDKTKVAVNKNNVANHTVLKQIEHNLSDKSRLVKKTQLKRSEYKILGERNTKETVDLESEINTSRVPEEYNVNIFDDDDFYHHLLRELIEVKSADLTDPVQLGRQWIQLQNLRSKMKRKIDTRATKGRKIRYGIHAKLVNFMAPMDESTWTNEARNELCNSLFGKKKV